MFLIRLIMLASVLASGVPALAASDPTRPPIFGGTKAKPVHQPIKLSMILKDNNNMRAIINESVVGVSDVVAGAKVTAIKDDHVVLSRDGQRITLRMPLAEVRKDSSHDE